MQEEDLHEVKEDQAQGINLKKIKVKPMVLQFYKLVRVQVDTFMGIHEDHHYSTRKLIFNNISLSSSHIFL